MEMVVLLFVLKSQVFFVQTNNLRILLHAFLFVAMALLSSNNVMTTIHFLLMDVIKIA